ncbi:FecCD family ABC transporter permease [Paenibacillus sp. IITD108]|uniref:FecCD family ABC transporter permease n=1 Tax=Paenibacillus sp. IITD108 TaxID=3116649 RepID=UPI002F41EE13
MASDKFFPERRKANLAMMIGIIGLLFFSFLALFLGRYILSPTQVITAFYDKFYLGLDTTGTTVVIDIRLSRVLLNILVGSALAAAGTAFQGIFQNRLVSPEILGVSNGAGFGAALALLISGGSTGFIVPFSFLGGILSICSTYSFFRLKKDHSVLTLVLSGIIVGSIFNALLSLIKLVADTDSILPAITYWLMGSFSNTTMSDVFLAAIPIGIGTIVLFVLRWQINILSLGDEEAIAQGIRPQKMRLVIIAACTLVTAACVSVTGMIGWVGLIIPNIFRSLIGANNRYLIPLTCIYGANFILIVDIIARTVTPAEIPIGILIALVGAPLFLIVYQKSKEGAAR